MIIIHDSPSLELSHIEALADMSEEFALFDYVSIIKDKEEWVGQIVETNRNISTVGDRVSPVILHGLKLMQKHRDVQSVESVQIYKILIMGFYKDNVLTTAGVRPLPGAVVEKLNSKKTLSILNLPPEQENNVIGVLANAENIPITIGSGMFNHHIMVAGGTGSGKSNVAANLVNQAIKMNKCVIIHDAKPDYQKIDKANSDTGFAIKRAWEVAGKYNLSPQGAAGVCKLGFQGYHYSHEMNHLVKFKLGDFDNATLAGIFFPRSNEALQYENFLNLLGNQGKNPSLEQVIEAIEDKKGSEEKDGIHEKTALAMLRKIRARKSQMPWLAASMKPARARDALHSSLDSPRGENDGITGEDIDRLLGAGRIIIVNYSQMSEDDYALILSFFLRKCSMIRRGKKSNFGIVQLIDEAHRIFDSESRHSDSLDNIFARVMREGRTLDHSIILSLQNASLIPGSVMTNINSRFVMRQNSRYDSDRATETMGKEFSVQSMRLGTGHSLVSVHESTAVVPAQMFPSPYELMRTDN